MHLKKCPKCLWQNLYQNLQTTRVLTRPLFTTLCGHIYSMTALNLCCIHIPFSSCEGNVKRRQCFTGLLWSSNSKNNALLCFVSSCQSLELRQWFIIFPNIFLKSRKLFSWSTRKFWNSLCTKSILDLERSCWRGKGGEAFESTEQSERKFTSSTKQISSSI